MKISQRLLALFVLVALTVSAAFTGCSRKEPPENPASAAAATPQVADFGSPVTLKWLSTTSVYSGPWTGWLDNFVFEKTGVHIEMVQCTAERMQASLASGELSDLVTFSRWNDLEIAIKGNMLVNLDEHLDALPNVVKNTGKALQYVRDERSAGTGKAYCIPDYIGQYEIPIDTGVYAANVRWDIYKAIGAPEVNTLEDFLPVLKKMQDYYPKTPDGQKVYAFSLFPDWDGGYFYNAASIFVILGHFEGLANYFQIWNTRTNEITDLLDPDGLYIRALKLYNNAFRMGLLDPDSMTQTHDNSVTKLNAGAVLTAWNCYDGSSYNTQENINADPPVGFKPVIFKDFYAATMGDYPVGSTSPIAIGKNTENVDACLRFLDFLANYDNLMVVYNGPQGILWDIGSDGKPYVTDKYFKEYMTNPKMEMPGGGTLDKPGLRNMIMESTTNPAYGLPLGMAYWPEVAEKQIDNKLAKDWAEFYGYDTPINLIEDQGRLVKRPLANSLMETAPEDIAAVADQIGDIVKTTSWKMVYAKNDAEFDALYQDMVTNANTLGVKNVTDWAKGALERAHAKAARYAP